MKRRPLAYLPGKHCPPITAEQERALLEDFHATGSVFSRNRLIEGNLRYITVLAIRQRGRLDEEDAIQEAVIALMEVLPRYPIGHRHRLARWAMTPIRRALTKANLETTYPVRIPRGSMHGAGPRFEHMRQAMRPVSRFTKWIPVRSMSHLAEIMAKEMLVPSLMLGTLSA